MNRKVMTQGTRGWVPLGWATAARCGLSLVSVVTVVVLGCGGPEYEDAVVQVPARQHEPAPYLPPEPTYQRESSQCEVDTEEANACFAAAYRQANQPRLAFVANTPSSVIADTRPPSEEAPLGDGTEDQAAEGAREGVTVITNVSGNVANVQGTSDGSSDAHKRLTPTSEAVGLPQAERWAVPVDRAAVEDQFIDVFTSLSPDVRIVDLGVAREQLEREARTVGAQRDEPFVRSMRDRNLADMAVIFDLRIVRLGCASRQELKLNAAVNSSQGVISSSAEGSASTAPIITIALTGRAIRINDGGVVATVTPPRREVTGDVELGDALQEICECGAMALAARMCPRLRAQGDVPTVTVRIQQAPGSTYVLEFMRWVEKEFPGSQAVFRSYGGGQGEFTVDLHARVDELIDRAQREGQFPNVTLDAARSSEHAVTFIAIKK